MSTLISEIHGPQESALSGLSYDIRVVNPNEPAFKEVQIFRANGYDSRHRIVPVLTRLALRNLSYKDADLSHFTPEMVIRNPALLTLLSKSIDTEMYKRIVVENGTQAVRNIVKEDHLDGLQLPNGLRAAETLAIYRESQEESHLVATVRAVFDELELLQRMTGIPKEFQHQLNASGTKMELTRLTVETDGPYRSEPPFLTELLYKASLNRLKERCSSDGEMENALIVAIMPPTVASFVRASNIDIREIGGHPNWDDQDTRRIAAEFPGYWMVQKPTVYQFTSDLTTHR